MSDLTYNQKSMLQDAHEEIEGLLFNNPPIPIAQVLILQTILDRLDENEIDEIGPILELLNDMIDNHLFDSWENSQIEILYDTMYLIGRAMPVTDQIISGEIKISVQTGPDTSYMTFGFLPDDIVNGWISEDNLTDIRYIVQADITKKTNAWFRYDFKSISLANGIIYVYGNIISSDF